MRNIFRVTVSDGTTFDCELRPFGSRAMPLGERWSIRSATKSYVGPAAGDDSPEAVAAMIETWWEQKQGLRGHGDARRLLDRLLRDLEDEPPHASAT
jgi:hypothetical protein